MTNRTSNNNLKKRLNKFFNNLKFKSFNLTFPKKIVFLGIIMGYISLFLPWIIDIEEKNNFNSFYSLSGNIGFLLVFILLIPIMTIMSTNYKEKLKLYSDLTVKNHFLIITIGLIIISFSIISLSFINGLHTFFQNIVYGNGVILSMTSGFIILFGGILQRKEYYSNSSEIILDKLNKSREAIKDDDNMKLPI